MRSFYLNFTILVVGIASFSESFAGSELKSRISAVDGTINESVAASGVQPRITTLRTAHYAGISGADYSIFFTDERAAIPLESNKASFDCVGTIYTVIKLSQDDHDLRNTRIWLQWINPLGKTELLSTKLKYAEDSLNAYRWASMLLSRPPGGGLFSLLDHSAGMERFIGDWQVVVHVGDKELPPQNFTIEC